MPIKHAALKQLRKDRKRRVRNQAYRSTLKTLTKRLIALLQSQQINEAATLLRTVSQEYDHAASKGIIHPNTAARTKSRLAHRVNQRLAAAR